MIGLRVKYLPQRLAQPRGGRGFDGLLGSTTTHYVDALQRRQSVLGPESTARRHREACATSAPAAISSSCCASRHVPGGACQGDSAPGPALLEQRPDRACADKRDQSANPGSSGRLTPAAQPPNCSNSLLRHVEQRPHVPARPERAAHRHRRHAFDAGAAQRLQQQGLGLVLAMMRREQAFPRL